MGATEFTIFSALSQMAGIAAFFLFIAMAFYAMNFAYFGGAYATPVAARNAAKAANPGFHPPVLKK